jgi:hypothetical protein
LQKHAAALTLLIRALEAKHGVVARSVELRAAEIALVAQRGEMDAQTAAINVRKEVYNPEVVRALRNYASHLQDAKLRLGDAMNVVTSELESYGVGVEGEENKERTMREMARVYREMGIQMREVKADLERLGRG